MSSVPTMQAPIGRPYSWTRVYTGLTTLVSRLNRPGLDKVTHRIITLRMYSRP